MKDSDQPLEKIRAGPRTFWCFISYRHADNQTPGRQWATWLHQAIETYEVPVDLIGTVNEHGGTIPERIFPVFRDEEELPVDADLASPIYRALDQSKFLLVICSPRAVESTYVAKEILYFKKLGRSERVLAVMVAGEPNARWDKGKQASGFLPADECFPEPLRHAVDAEGNLSPEQAEPIAADFRLPDGGGEGWTTPEAYRQALVREGSASGRVLEDKVKRYRERAELMKLKVLAGILGVPLGTLTQRDKAYQLARARRKQRITLWVASALAALALSLVGGIIATVWQARRAEASQARAEKRFADVRGLANALLNDIAPRIERLAGATEARQALVAQSLRYLDSLAGEAATDLTLQAELAAAYEKVGVLQGDSRKPSLSDFRGAIASLEKAQQIRRRLLAIKPNDTENRRLLADNLRLLAIRRMAQNDIEGGLSDSKEALRIYDKLVAEMPGSLELRRAFLETQVEDAMNFGKDAEAIPPLQQVAGKIDELRRTASADTETERILARCLAALGSALSWENRQPEAEVEMTRAVTIAESLVARFPHDMNLKQDLWKIYESAGGIYEEIDDARAFELCDRSRRVAEEIIAADRANAQARHNLSKSFSRLGISASHLDRPVAALDFLERARAIVLELQEKDPLNRGYDRDLSVLYIRTGLARSKQGDFAGALEAHLKGAELCEKQLADDPANTTGLYDLAIAYRHAGLVHKELAKSDDQQVRQVHRAAEKENYQRALNSLLKAQAQKVLPEYSRELIETYRKDIEELETSR